MLKVFTFILNFYWIIIKTEEKILEVNKVDFIMSQRSVIVS